MADIELEKLGEGGEKRKPLLGSSSEEKKEEEKKLDLEEQEDNSEGEEEEVEANPELRIELFKKLKSGEHHHHKHDEDIDQLLSYESLDYTVIENQLFIEEQRKITSARKGLYSLIKWLAVIGTGVGTGVLAFILFLGVKFLSWSRWGVSEDIIVDSDLGMGYLYFMGLSCVFVAFSSYITCFHEPTAAGSGISEVKAYLNGVALQKVLRWQTLVVKIIGIAFAYTGGMCIGKEGPLIQSGAIIGLILCYTCIKFRWDHYKREFVACGAAAGIAAAFGAPSGSVLFVLEEAATYWSVPLLWMVMLTGFLSTLSFNICKSAYEGHIMNINSPGLVTYGYLTTDPYKLWEILIIALIGVVGGILGALFCWINMHITLWRKKFKMTTPIRRWVEVVLLAFITATFFYWAPWVAGECRENGKDEDEEFVRYDCPKGYHNNLATLSFTKIETTIKNYFHAGEEFGWAALLTYFFIMYACCVVTYGTGIPSGLLEPGMLVGCSYGRLIGELFHHVYDEVRPGTFALMGAASFVGGVTRLTISLTIMMMEVTNSLDYLLPLMITTLCSKFVGDYFGIAIYDLHIELKNIPYVEALPPKHMEQLATEDVMIQPVITFKQIESAGHVYRTMKRCTHNAFPIVDDEDHLTGIMQRNQYIVLLKRRILIGGDPYVPKPTYGDFAPSIESTPFVLPKYSNREERGLDGFQIDVGPYMNPNRESVSMDVPLTAVFRRYRALGLRHLIVVDNQNRVVGIITRKQLMTDFSRDLS